MSIERKLTQIGDNLFTVPTAGQPNGFSRHKAERNGTCRDSAEQQLQGTNFVILTSGYLGKRVTLLAGALLAAFLLQATGESGRALAQDQSIKTGRVTGLPIPRFVSFKAPAVNLRVGPGRKYSISWLYKKRGLPVEVIQEFDRWRRIRDADGTTGWVLHSLLSPKRTAILAPWDRELDEKGRVVHASMYDGLSDARTDASVAARMQAGLLVDIRECESGWCEVASGQTYAWLQQDALWGTYPGEKVDD